MKNNLPKYFQNSANYSNHYNNYPININTNSMNINNHNSIKNQQYYIKPQSLKNTFTIDNRISKFNKQNYNLNLSNNTLNSINNASNGNMDNQSSISNRTIKSMVNKIQISNKEISFKDLKNKNYILDAPNDSKSSNEGNINFKCSSTNSSFNSNIFNHKTKHLYDQGTKFQIKRGDNKQLNLMIKEKIENAKINEEIQLPPVEIVLESLKITKPIKIKGQINSCLYINDGSISVDFESNNINNNNFVKFSQIQIIYNDNKINKEKKITTLFKIHQNSFLELEDCDIVFQNVKASSSSKISSGNKDKKSVAFSLPSNKKKDNSYDFNPSRLTLTNTRIHNFYQSIRAGQNCIININKSAFIQNYGKAIVMINPIYLNINETLFEYNEDNSIHIKYMEECLYEEKRQLLFNKNEFNTTLGNNICIEGIKNKKIDLSVVLTKNNFHNSVTDGVLIYDLIYNHFEVIDNIFKKNNGNGLNIQKSFYKEILNNDGKTINMNLNSNLYQPIKIKDNKFIENKGFGLFVNDCIIEVISNKFTINRQSGMALCNIIIDDPNKGLEGININLIKGDFSSILKSVKKSSVFLKNSFYENGESGLYIYGYPYQVIIQESIFTSNCRHGIEIDLDVLYIKNKTNNRIKVNKDFYTKLSEYKSINQIQKINEISNIFLNKCIIEKNKKDGISLNSCLIYCEETFIINNLNYTISIKRKEYQHCFKQGNRNQINGSIGGDWGEINLNKRGNCGFSCLPKTEINYKKKQEIIKKVPSYSNQSEDDKSTDEDIKVKRGESYNDFRLKNNEKIYKRSTSASFNKKNKDKNKNINEDDGGCNIF